MMQLKRLLIVIGVMLPDMGFSQSLSLSDYLTLQLQSHYQIGQQDVQMKAQKLALEVGVEYWKPNVTAVSGWQTSETKTDETVITDAKDVSYDQWRAGFESTWTSDIGTQVSLNLTQINGEGLGSTALDNSQKTQKVTVTLSQPLLKNNAPEYVRINKYLAENTWQQFLNAQHLTRLEVLRDAFNGFLDYQVAYENWRIQQELLTSIEKSTLLVKRLYSVDKATRYEYEQAKLKLVDQQAQVKSAHTEVVLLQMEALLSLKMNTSYQLTPFHSLNALNQLLLTKLQAESNIEIHPEYVAASLKYDAAVLAYQQEADSLKPDLDLFYQHEKNHYEISAGNEVNTFGIRFSYLLTNKSNQQTKERLSANVEVAGLEQALVRKRLQLYQHNFRDRVGYLVKQVDVLAQQVALAKQGLEQQFERYKVGNVSYFSLEEIQQDLLDKQINWLTAQKTLSSALVQLFYYLQVDERTVL